jgi:hypothetical protein
MQRTFRLERSYGPFQTGDAEMKNVLIFTLLTVVAALLTGLSVSFILFKLGY